MKLFKTILSLCLAIVLLQESQWLTFIKSHEGLRLEEYKDILGNRTIYYGHVCTEKDNNYYPKDSAYAEYVLKEDFNNRKILIQKLYPDWEEHKVLAITHFVYAKGIGKYMRSRLRISIETGSDPKKVYKEWIEWGIVDGKVNYKSLYNRTIEYNTFYYGTKPRWGTKD